MAFKKGNIPWNKDIHYSKKMYKKIFTEEWRDKHSQLLTGREILWASKISETRKKRITDGTIKIKKGKEHHSWKGGANKWQRQQNMKRLNEVGILVCEICGVDETTHGKKLDIHHKDGDHSNNFLNNLMLLCTSCHSKGHFNKRKFCNKCNRFLGENHKCPDHKWYVTIGKKAIIGRKNCPICGKLLGKDINKHLCAHPKGMLGKHHTEETKRRISASVKKVLASKRK